MRVPAIGPAGRAPKTALVVLGMHRSGTSALARVLNLCGAFLPAKLKPPKLGVNPKGFWEPEAVLDLNVRVMRHLGGDWSHVDFTLPGAGEFTDEFENDACALLAAEYEDRDIIALKDPADLRSRAALASCSSSPAAIVRAHAVPVRPIRWRSRNRSMRAATCRLAEGMALWLAYMQRVAEFADAHADVVYIRYTDLLDDWRGVVERIVTRLDVPLDAAGERPMRSIVSSKRACATRPPATMRSMPARQRRWVTPSARCTAIVFSDVTGTALSIGGSLARSAAAASDRHRGRNAPGESRSTTSFVLCIEDNAIRDQALLPAAVSGDFAGRYGDAPILAYAPRPGLGIDAATRRELGRSARPIHRRAAHTT